MEHFEPIHLAQIGKAQDRGMGTRNQQVLDKILVFDSRRASARSAASLGLIVRERLRLGVSTMRNGDHAILLGNQVLDRQIMG